MAYGIVVRRTRNNTQGRSRPANVRQELSETRSEGKVKVSAQQYYDKYIVLAREAMSSGDRVTAEGYYQHAEHYLRIMNEYKPVVIDTDRGEGETAFLSADQEALIPENIAEFAHMTHSRPQMTMDPIDYEEDVI